MKNEEFYWDHFNSINQKIGGKYRDIYEHIENWYLTMSVNDIKKTIKYFRKLTLSNCSWIIYSLRPTFLEVAKEHLMKRVDK